MEELSVKDVVKFNKASTKVFGPFMSERIVLPEDSSGEILSQFLAEERRWGRYPLLGNGTAYQPIKEETIVVAPREWGATTPSDLVGALVGVKVIGTIPIIKDNHITAEILIVRLTDPDGVTPADSVRADWASAVETDVYLGMDTWVDYPPGIHTQPEPFPTPEEAEKAEEEEEEDADNYW